MGIIPALIYRRIQHRSNLVRIVDNIGWLFVDRFLRMGVGLLVGVWLARYLGPESLGLLSFSTAFTSIFAAAASLGLSNIAVREIVNDPKNAGFTLGTVAWLQLIGGLVAYILSLIGIALIRPVDVIEIEIVAVFGFAMLFKCTEIVVYWFESQVQSKYTVWIQNCVFLVFAALKAALILLKAKLMVFVWVMLGEAVTVAVLLSVLMERQGLRHSSLRFRAETAKKLLKDCWPLLMSSIAVAAYMKIDQIMLAEMIGERSVGIYSVAARISEIWYFVPVAIVASLSPAIIESKKKSELLFYSRLQKLYDLMVLLSVAVAIPLTFLATPVVELMFGRTYSEAGPILAILGWNSVFVFLGVASSQWFLAENRQLLSLQRTIIGVIVNIGLNFWLIPSFEAIGAAIASLISYGTVGFFADLLNSKTRKMFIMKASAMNPLLVIRRSGIF